MHNLEIDSPVPYIALGVLKEEKKEKKENSRTEIVLTIIVFVVTLIVLIHTQTIEYKITIIHEHGKPNDNKRKEYEAINYYYYDDEESIQDQLYVMCSNVVPLEWPPWDADPQLLSSKKKDDLDFCSMVFSEILD